MATRVIGQASKEPVKGKKTRAKDAQMKPLAGEFLKSNMNKNGEEYLISSGKLTAKGYLLLQCEEFAILIPGGTEVATTLLDDLLPELNNKKANRLVAILSSSNRFGANIGITDTEQAYYCFDSEEESFFISDTKPSREKAKPKKLTIDQFSIAIE